ncbi:MAGE family-domain-containing protein [Boeremia exigua]|uniref:MAGE family-domain-containing protein n=1 Tax=Boeremia exigua TaxID=749465 RepID=UPI001E8E5180|nr:MAGE family-domain-containing protein [Boeremia exigua]KAH6633768.1 MAGE family-domain-containing protein [Boeremia exigua]
MEESQHGGGGSVDQLSKSLVRYALSCEAARKPIKRQDVNEKVLGSHARLFKTVFDQANSELMDVFGMAMAELPRGERVTARQKRAAADSSKTSNMWVLQTVVPAQYRLPDALGPAPPASRDDASAYVGLYTMVIALVVIAGGRLPEAKLDRALRRMNADQTTPLATTEKTLALMAKDGYVVRVREAVGGEETVDYVVGPRGRVEVGREGFAALVETIYGADADADELQAKIRRTLDVAGATSGVARKRGREGEE